MNNILKSVKNICMKKLFLMKNPELFQGEKYLQDSKNYFEGWYFKITNTNNSISFIPGINIDAKEKKAFIQIITKNSSYFVDYDINDFKFSYDPFYIQIGNSFFSKEKIYVNIVESNKNLKITGNLKYSDSKNINIDFLNPNIMGPFSYVPNMECNHAILCMKNKTFGVININNIKMNLNNGTGYIEKDWGYSFPKEYIWCQGNDFKDANASFMISIANVPFKFFNFQGIICVLIINDQEYKFTTYNNAKLIKWDVCNNSIDITLKKGGYIFNLKSEYSSENKLVARVKGKMEKDIFESITSLVHVTLSKGNKIVFENTSKNCGLEIVQK